MGLLSLTLPDDLIAFAEEQAAKRGLAGAGEYVAALIGEAWKRHAERERIDALLLEGIDSGPETPLEEEDWDRIRREGAKLAEERRQRKG
jgi:antitoxin ParD1/3/4